MAKRKVEKAAEEDPVIEQHEEEEEEDEVKAGESGSENNDEENEDDSNEGEDEDEEEENEGIKSDDDDEEEEEEEEKPFSIENEIKWTRAEWTNFFSKCEFQDEMEQHMMRLMPYEKRPDRVIVITKWGDNMAKGFCDYLLRGKRIPLKAIRQATETVFGRHDIFHMLANAITEETKGKSDKVSEDGVWNLWHMLKNVPNPTKRAIPPMWSSKTYPVHILRRNRKTKVLRAFSSLWLSLLKMEMPNKLAVALIPYMIDEVLDSMMNAQSSADFFFKGCDAKILLSMFKRGDSFAILSLGALFKLIVVHNYEYPNFYDEVYSLTTASVLYMDHKQKFMQLVDTFLTSTHLPTYIVASFVKRFGRLLLNAPLDVQEPLLGLIRNLLTRHPNIRCLMHRDVPQSLEADPFVDGEILKNSRALESSLWEIKAIQKHWYLDVAKRANFIDKPQQKMESFVRFRGVNELFAALMAKKYGADKFSKDSQYENVQDGDDGDDVDENGEPVAKKAKQHPQKGKSKKGGKAAREEEAAEGVPINFTPPGTELFPTNSLKLDYAALWV